MLGFMKWPQAKYGGTKFFQNLTPSPHIHLQITAGLTWNISPSCMWLPGTKLCSTSLLRRMQHVPLIRKSSQNECSVSGVNPSTHVLLFMTNPFASCKNIGSNDKWKKNLSQKQQKCLLFISNFPQKSSVKKRVEHVARLNNSYYLIILYSRRLPKSSNILLVFGNHSVKIWTKTPVILTDVLVVFFSPSGKCSDRTSIRPWLLPPQWINN